MCRHVVASCLVFCCVLLSVTAVHALTVESGLVPYQVVQCDKDGKASVMLGGKCTAAGMLRARVMATQKEIVPWTDLGKMAPDSWQGTLPGIPAGGPYRVEVSLRDDAGKALEDAAIPDVLVGDIWVMAGQSNMQGVGNRIDVEMPHVLVHTFSMSYEWRLAEEPLHTLAESPDVCHANFPNDEERQKAIAAWRDGPKGAGLGLSFAKEMVARTGRPVGLIASAHGGTSMGQWDPTQKDKGGESMYGSMCKQVQAAGGKVRGVLWYQGESEANPDAQPIYKDGMKRLVAAMRTDFGVTDLPFYYVQLSRWAGDTGAFPRWNQIQTDQLTLEQDLGVGAMVPAVDLGLDDCIHVGTPGLKVLGYRLACQAERDLFGGKTLRGPRFEKITSAGTPYAAQLRVRFTSVNGGLKADGRVSGFSISDGPDGPDKGCIFNQEIAPDDPSTVILWVEKLPENPQLWYGRGLNPYCNVLDQANMGMPVFGPVPIPK